MTLIYKAFKVGHPPLKTDRKSSFLRVDYKLSFGEILSIKEERNG